MQLISQHSMTAVLDQDIKIFHDIPNNSFLE